MDRSWRVMAFDITGLQPVKSGECFFIITDLALYPWAFINISRWLSVVVVWGGIIEHYAILTQVCLLLSLVRLFSWGCDVPFLC